MKKIVIKLLNTFLLILLTVFIIWGTIELFKLVITNYQEFWSIFLLGTGIACTILLIYYPFWYSLLDVRDAYKEYKTKRPVKILNKVNTKLNKNGN